MEATKERYRYNRASGNEEFLEKDRDRIRNYRKDNPEKYKAHNAVNNALRDGKLERPCVCSSCGKACKPQGHHWSYDKEYWLDVAWLCVKCHSEEHKRLKEEGRDSGSK